MACEEFATGLASANTHGRSISRVTAQRPASSAWQNCRRVWMSSGHLLGATLLSKLPASHAKYLGRFAGVMTLKGVEPSEVNTDHFELYREYIAKAAIRTGEHAFRWTCHYWEKARAEVPGWPDTHAPAIPRRKLVWLPWSAFPPSLERDIDAYYAGRVQHREFDLDALFDGTPTKRIRPNTARNYKEYLQGVASAAVGAGVPANDIRCLADLLGPAVLERAITHLVKGRVQIATRTGASSPSADCKRADTRSTSSTTSTMS